MKRATVKRRRASAARDDGRSPARERKGRPGSPDFELEDYVFYVMAHVEHRYHEGMAEEFRRRGLTRPQWRCLMGLHARGPMSIGELGALTLLQQSTISRVVARMEDEGLIVRRPRDGDGRVVEAEITELGLARLEELARIAGIQYERAVEGIDEADIDQLRETLGRMLANLTRSPFA